MSKFFFKGRIDPRQSLSSYGFSTKRSAKPGSKDYPLTLSVKTAERKTDVEAILKAHEFIGRIKVDAEKDEDLLELDALLNTPKSIEIEKTPKRNDPCSCGSGKKYKKCCAITS